MPSKNGIGRDERHHLAQRGASEPLPQHRETAPLRIVQPQPACGQLCFQRAIVLAKERDHVGLPAAQGRDQDNRPLPERRSRDSAVTTLC